MVVCFSRAAQTHIDIVEDFDQDLVKQLQALADKHDFVIWEDRKFADIGQSRPSQRRESGAGNGHSQDKARADRVRSQATRSSCSTRRACTILPTGPTSPMLTR